MVSVKSIHLLLFAFVFCLSTFASGLELDELNGTTSETINFTSAGNTTRYLEIFKYSNVINATVNLTGNATNPVAFPYLEIGTPDGTYEWSHKGGLTYDNEVVYLSDIVTLGWHGVVASEDFFWVATGTYNKVYKYYSNNNSYADYNFSIGGSGNTNANGLTIYDNYFWITDWSDAEIYKYYINGTYTEYSFDTSEQTTTPSGIDSDGEFFWITDGSSNVYKYYTNGSYADENISISSSGNDDANGLAVDDDFLWISDESDDEIYKYYKNGTYTNYSYDTSSQVSGVGSSLGISIFDNKLYLVSDSNDKVVMYPFVGNYSTSEITENLSASINIAINNGSCNCTGCFLTSNTCSIPWLFGGNSAGLINWSSLSVLYNKTMEVEVQHILQNNTFVNVIDVNFTASATSDESNLTNSTFYLYNSTLMLINQTTTSLSGTFNELGVYITSLSDGIYFWFFDVFNEADITDVTDNYTMTIDTVNPNIDFATTSVADDVKSTTNIVNIVVDVLDTNLDNITYYLYNSSNALINTTVNQLETNATNDTLQFLLPLHDNYYYNSTVTDKASNTNSSETRTFSYYTIDIELVSPENDTQTASNRLFNCSVNTAVDNVDITNITFYLWNSTGYLNNSVVNNATGSANSTIFNWTFTDVDVFKWNCYSCVDTGQCSFAEQNYTITSMLDKPAININYPADVYLNFTQNIQLNYTPTRLSEDLDTCLLYSNFTGSWLLNDSDDTIENQQVNTFNKNLSEGFYKWGISCNTTLNNIGHSNNKTFHVDVSEPIVSINQPASFVTNKTITIELNYSDITPASSCYYNITIGEIIARSDTVINVINFTEEDTLALDGDYYITAWCTDSVNLLGISNKSFTIDTSGDDDDVGGGGGGGSTVVVNIDGNVEWDLTTDVGTDSYEVILIKGETRTKLLYFENLAESTQDITTSCEDVKGKLCSYIEFSEESFTLPTGKDILKITKVFITPSTELTDSEYIFNIIATDEQGLDDLITIKASFTKNPVLILGVKLVSNKKFTDDFTLPYLILFVISYLFIQIASYKLLKDRFVASKFITFLLSILAALALIYLI